MTWLSMVGLISSIALFLPIIVILMFRLAWYKSFPALLAYYFFVSGYNFLQLDFIGANSEFLYYYNVLNNLLDAPLMLTFMTYFSKTAVFRKRMKLFISVLVFFELVVIAAVGFSLEAAVIALAPGLAVVFILGLMFFVHQIKIAVVYQKAAGKAFITSSILFAYGGYIFVYIVYYLLNTPYKEDSLLVYYLVSTFSSVLIATGIFFERKRVKQLHELRIAREELRVIYGGS